MRLLITLGVVLSAGLAVSARADERPATLPTRDVDVTYAMAGFDGHGTPLAMTERMRWDVESDRMRIDPPSGGVYLLMDYRAHNLIAVRDSERSVLEMPADTGVAPGPRSGASFVRQRDDVVAGVPCTDWTTQDSSGQPTTVCLTKDGVLLRAKSSTRVLVEAVRVNYGPVDPAAFQVPPDFRRVTPH